MAHKDLLTSDKIDGLKINFQNRLGWKSDFDRGIIIENTKLGVNIKYYGIFDEQNNLLYDTIGINEREGNSVVVIADQHGNIGLINEFRPMPGKDFIACVRGFAENNELKNETAIREMIEEVGESSIDGVKLLTQIYQNTTFFENSINIFLINVISKNIEKKIINNEEYISKFRFYTRTEVLKMIKYQKINCQMTLSALMAYFAFISLEE